MARTDEVIQWGYAISRAKAAASNPNKPSPSQGSKFLRVVPLAGMANFPISVELQGAQGGTSILIFEEPGWQYANCKGARVIPCCFADAFGVGAQPNSTDPDTEVPNMYTIDPPGFNSVQKRNGYFSGLYAFQWADDPNEVMQDLVVPNRRPMLLTYQAALGATGTTTFVAPYGVNDFASAFGAGLLSAGLGYNQIRHQFGGAGYVAPAMPTFRRYALDPWSGAPYLASVFQMDPTQGAIRDEIINTPNVPTWILLVADTPNITWTCTLS